MLNDYLTPGTPDFWLLRLGRKLRDREEHHLKTWRDYLRGEHPLPEHPKKDPQVVEAFRRFQRTAKTNLTPIPVEAATNRLTLKGILDADGRAMTEAWNWGKLSRLESRQNQLYRLALGQSVGYLYVTVTEHDGKPVPQFSVEHPRQVITEDDPFTGRPKVGLKAWHDDIENVGHAVLVIPQGQSNAGVYHYRTDQRSTARLPWGDTNWTLAEDPKLAPLSVPFVPFYARSEIGETPVAIFDPVIPIQDRVNWGVFNRMSTERTMAFPINTVSGEQVRTQIDPLSGIEVAVNPFKAAPGNTWVAENPDARFSQLPAAQIDGFLKSFESDVLTFFVLTSTPAYYLPGGDMVNVSTDTILALDANHVALVNEFQQHFGESFEDAFRIGAELIGSDLDFSLASMAWKDPRQLNPAVWGTYATQLKQVGFSTPMIAEEIGWSPERVERVRVEDARQQLLAAAGTANVSNVRTANDATATTGTNPAGNAGGATGTAG